MGDHHDRLAELAHGAAHEREDLGAGARVEVAGRLVGEDDLRPAGQGPGDGDALLLAAGELARAVRRAGRRARRSRRPGRATAWSGLRPASVIGSVMFSSAVSVGIRLNAWKMKPIRSRRSSVSCLSSSAGEVDVADEDAARREGVEAGDAVHQRRLARAGRAHDGGELTGLEVDGDAVERRTSASPVP